MKKNRYETCYHYHNLEALTKSVTEFASKYGVDISEVYIETCRDYDDSPYLQLNCDTEETEVEKKIRLDQQKTYKAARLRQFEQLKKEFEGE